MYPSIKTLKTIAPERARELRRVLETTSRNEIEHLLGIGPTAGETKYPATRKWYLACFHPMHITTAKMSIADEILGTYGVESIPAGHNQKSPMVEYCNTGDTYASTLMYVYGKGYRVGCWGDIVERGNYD